MSLLSTVVSVCICSPSASKMASKEYKVTDYQKEESVHDETAHEAAERGVAATDK